MTAVQETVSRISIVTQRGLTSVIGDTYGKKVRQASGFYAVIVASLAVGLALNLLGVDPIKALYYAAVLNGTVAPVLMFFIFRIGSSKKIMGQFTGPWGIRIFGWIATVLMGMSAVTLVVLMITGRV